MKSALPYLPLLLLVAACAPRPEAPAYRNLEASYVGIEACGACHADKVATYVEAQMGRSWEPATLANSKANFDDPAPVYDAHNNYYYQALRQGDSLFISEYRLVGKDTVHRRVERIDYIVGSGHHTNSHIMDVGGYLYQMPLTWYAQDKTWDLPPGFQGPNNSRFSRPIPLKCITCHNAMPAYVDGSENKYDDVPHGIDCERCHGPGSAHIEAMRAGEAVNVATQIDYTIVNPAKAPLDLQFDICQGCHLQGAAVNKDGKTFADFRPGMPLSDIENVFWPRYADSLRQFVMASHPDRLRQSACFQASRSDGGRPLTCITCHDPHVSIETLGEDHYRQACQGCHTVSEAPECPTEEAAQGGNCVTCHMPASGSRDIPHVRITDHFIREPDPAATEVLSAEEVGAQRRFIRLASLVDKAPTAYEVAQGYLTYYEEVTNHPGFLDSAAVYLQRARATAPLEEVAAPLIRMHFLRHDYQAIAQLSRSLGSVSDAWTAYRIGEAFLNLGAPGEARRYLEEAVRLAPEHLRFMAKLATAYSQEGRQSEAIALFDRVLEANPKLSEAYNDRGYAHVLLADTSRAERDFLAALALDPDLEMALGNLASLLYNTGRAAQARPFARRLLDIDGSNEQYRRLWSIVQ